MRAAGDPVGMQVKSRHHLRSDEIRSLTETIADRLGVDVDGDSFERVELRDSDRDVVLVDGEPFVASFDDEPFLTVRGANAFPPQRRVVTVDAGAVSFVSDGADVMRPGIVEADEVIEPGDLVVVAEETHGKVLAVGRALEPGADMVGDAGKVVESIHHVGDELYDFSP
jgi:PUA domain protein